MQSYVLIWLVWNNVLQKCASVVWSGNFRFFAFGLCLLWDVTQAVLCIFHFWVGEINGENPMTVEWTIYFIEWSVKLIIITILLSLVSIHSCPARFLQLHWLAGPCWTKQVKKQIANVQLDLPKLIASVDLRCKQKRGKQRANIQIDLSNSIGSPALLKMAGGKTTCESPARSSQTHKLAGPRCKKQVEKHRANVEFDLPKATGLTDPRCKPLVEIKHANRLVTNLPNPVAHGEW